MVDVYIKCKSPKKKSLVTKDPPKNPKILLENMGKQVNKKMLYPNTFLRKVSKMVMVREDDL